METSPTPEIVGDLSQVSPALYPPGRGERWRAWTRRFAERLHSPLSAFVIDLFRIATGLMVVVYYVRLFLEYSDYTSESGFLDHAMLQEYFWFTKLTLFFPGSPDAYKLGLLGLGMLGALMLTAGWRPKLGAALTWIIAVSVHRWNFAVINVDDSTITLLLWWMMFLPIGHCLTFRTRDWRAEVTTTVDGFFVRAFFANLFIYYLTAGLTKLWSPLWREGLALYVILKLPLARSNAWWDLADLSMMWIGNHATLLLEPLFPFLILMPKGHPLKYLGGLAQIGFHLSIPISIGVPYANLGLIVAMILVFHREIDDFFRRRVDKAQADKPLEWQPPKGTRGLIKVYLLVLALAMSKGIPGIGATYEPAMATLYWGGVAQEYHLFDWIDRYNWWVKHKVEVAPEGGESFVADSAELFPATVRGFIVQSYLLPMRWMRIPRPLTGEMRNSVLRQAAQRFVRLHRDRLGESGTVTVTTQVARVTRDNLDLKQNWPIDLMTFRYDKSGVVGFTEPVMPVPAGSKR